MINSKKKYLLDYISGNDLVGCSIDELENDPDFMLEVMKFTRDKKMYNLCSDTVKRDGYFVKNIIMMFKDDCEFIVDVADNYFDRKHAESSEFNIDDDEIVILLSNIVLENDEYDEELLQYTLKAQVIYSEVMSLTLEDDDKSVDFSCIELIYDGSKIMKDFFATQMLSELLYDNDNYTLESLIHSNIKSLDNFDKNSVEFLINYIKSVDESLGIYLCYNPGMLQNVKKSLGFIKKNWNRYINKINSEKMLMVSEEYDKFEFETGVSLDKLETLKTIFGNIGLSDIFERYISSTYNVAGNCAEFEEDAFEYNSIKYELDVFDDFELATDEFSVLRFINHMTKFAETVFKDDNIIPHDTLNNEEDKETSKENSSKCKIIKYDFGSKRK